MSMQPALPGRLPYSTEAMKESYVALAHQEFAARLRVDEAERPLAAAREAAHMVAAKLRESTAKLADFKRALEAAKGLPAEGELARVVEQGQQVVDRLQSEADAASARVQELTVARADALQVVDDLRGRMKALEQAA